VFVAAGNDFAQREHLMTLVPAIKDR
jgi:hypothetical protein